jgi:malate dehydrogenase
VVNYTTIGGIPLMDYIKKKKIPISKIQKIVRSNTNGWRRDSKLLKRGSAFYAPASSAIQMAEAFLHLIKKNSYLVQLLLNGQYGLKNMYMGMSGQS